MLEAAYVLPLIIVAMLAIVDAVNYAMDAIETTNVVQATYDSVMAQAGEQADNPSSAFAFVSCQNGKVDLNVSAVQSYITDAVSILLDKPLAPSDQVAVTKWNASPVNSYLIDVSVKSSTLFLPDAFSFQIHSKGILSLDYVCSS